MAESDEWASVETVDDGVESITRSRTGPSGVDQGIFEKIMMTVYMTNPWLLLMTAVGLYYLWQKTRSSHPQPRGNAAQPPPANPEEILARQEAQENARRRMQELYDQKAREHAIKQKEKEEQKRLEKLQNMEKYGSAYGRNGRTLGGAESSAQPEQQVLPKKEKSKLRPEYNPLMDGGSSGACFRPARRGGGAGGG